MKQDEWISKNIYIEWKNETQKSIVWMHIQEILGQERWLCGKRNQMSSYIWSGIRICREGNLSGVIEIFYILIDAWDMQVHAFVKPYETALFKYVHFIVHKSYLNQIFLIKTIQ